MKALYATDLCERAVLTYAQEKRARYAQYSGVTDLHINAALCRAMRDGLRYDLQPNVTRNRYGWTSKPSSPSDWTPFTPTQARDALAHEIWCDAVRAYNVAQGVAS